MEDDKTSSAMEPVKTPETPEKGKGHLSAGPAKGNSRAVSFISFVSPLRGVIALLAVFALGICFSPDAPGTNWPLFLTGPIQRGILFDYAEYGILATGMTLVILSGGIDLSVGSVLGASSVMFSLLAIGYGWPPLAAVGACILAGLAAGSLNGILISRFKMQPFVATLAMMVAARGAAKLISGGIKVQPGAQTWYKMQGESPGFYSWMTTPLHGLSIQPITLLFLLAILAAFLVVRYTRFGRHLYAIGGNEEAARLSGVRVSASKILAYALCAGLAALAGVADACTTGLGDPEAGFTYELDAIAAVVIGGTSLMGGRGGVIFTLIGTLIIGYIGKILSINAVPEAGRLLAKGGIIVVAVLIQQRKSA
ncbi:MAG: ABC transporter permease [Armatimonadota bacterium]|nr:ABC transporter permease [Armatimonadota bacterium]